MGMTATATTMSTSLAFYDYHAGNKADIIMDNNNNNNDNDNMRGHPPKPPERRMHGREQEQGEHKKVVHKHKRPPLGPKVKATVAIFDKTQQQQNQQEQGGDLDQVQLDFSWPRPRHERSSSATRSSSLSSFASSIATSAAQQANRDSNRRQQQQIAEDDGPRRESCRPSSSQGRSASSLRLPDKNAKRKPKSRSGSSVCDHCGGSGVAIDAAGDGPGKGVRVRATSTPMSVAASLNKRDVVDGGSGVGEDFVDPRRVRLGLQGGKKGGKGLCRPAMGFIVGKIYDCLL